MLERYTTEDYQNRKGNYPKSNVPTSIELEDNTLLFNFKNTDETTAENFVKGFCLNRNLVIESIKTFQDGDFQNDWVIVKATIKE